MPLMRMYYQHCSWSLGKWYLWRTIGLQVGGVTAAQTQDNVKMVVDTRELVGKAIYYFGVWEPNLTEWLRKRLAPGDTFVDVGANIGYFTLLASKLVGESGAVIAIEPQPASSSFLLDNIRRNRAQNIRVACVAAWNLPGRKTLFSGPLGGPSGLSSLLPQWVEHSAVACDVATESLGNIIHPEEVQQIKMIKIDVEGAEAETLEGLLPIIPLCREDIEIVVEAPEDGSQSEALVLILAGFRDRGFRMHRIANDYSMRSYIFAKNHGEKNNDGADGDLILSRSVSVPLHVADTVVASRR